MKRDPSVALFPQGDDPWSDRHFVPVRTEAGPLFCITYDEFCFHFVPGRIGQGGDASREFVRNPKTVHNSPLVLLTGVSKAASAQQNLHGRQKATNSRTELIYCQQVMSAKLEVA